MVDIEERRAVAQRAIEDLRRLRAGEEPDLADAPLIDGYYFELVGDLTIARGVATGHPTIPDGEPMRTSMIVAAGDGWIRTLSRFYRLGRPLGGGFS